MSEKLGKPIKIDLPPRLPQNEDELELVIKMLGNRKQADLGPQARKKIESLLGVYPSVTQASFWKRTIRRAYQESIADALAVAVDGAGYRRR